MPTATPIATEVRFTLPRGYVDPQGQLHREGTMRLATARDEIEPLRDPAVRQNDAYLTVLLLARVVTRVGAVTDITPELIESLFAADFDHLQRLYERLNADEDWTGTVSCPECGHTIEVDLREIEEVPPGE